MPTDKIEAARIALGALARLSGSFRSVPSVDGLAVVTVEHALRRRPRSVGRLHWSSDTGRYRETWITVAGGQPKLFHLYFGAWGRGARHSAYVVVFRRGSPQLEVRLSPARMSAAGSEPIRHRLAFFGKRYKAPTQLRDHALRLATRSGIPVKNRQAFLGTFDSENGHIRPGPRAVLRRILTCGLIKRSLVEAAQAGHQPRPTRSRRAKAFTPKRERFPKGQRSKIDLLLDSRFEAHGRHNHLVNRLHESLEAKGYHVDDRTPYDLLATRRGRATIIEVKGWRSDQLVGALRAAVGQLFYYAHLFSQDEGRRASLVAAVTHTPTPDLITFVEKTAGVGLVWLNADGRFGAGPLACRILPRLIDA